MIPSLEGWPTKAKGAPSPHEIRLTLLYTNTVMSQGYALTDHASFVENQGSVVSLVQKCLGIEATSRCF